ncbi:M12 family metallopeptidase [Candidatus Ornithobacterium hominis]|uniref:M12 family metallopeptidase n=1 Tax=Candidatus Ornithobacterium hominis TaxID=2497989 RepID=UPI0024BD01CA|nr:M12 family metallopeptidase [Candidatus Ornithobacterium hominis]CAI9429381.1 M12 family metallopeptidase [Candidatus Ornithobacterium hominis]
MKTLIILCSFFAIMFSSCNNEDDSQRVVIDPTALELNSFDELKTLKSGVEIAKKGDDYIYLGDILLSAKQLKKLEETGSIFPEESLTEENKPAHVTNGRPISPVFGVNNLPSDVGTYAVGGSPYQGMFWAMLRYTFSPNLSNYQKEQILDAISHIEELTNARFYNATGEPTVHPTYGFAYPYVEFTPSDVNNSYVGRIGGKQILNLYNFDRGTIVHEICHALGMFHEQCRADRDSYITVHYDNISSQNKHNFQKETRNYYILGDFDFNSIMLYSSYAFALDYSKPTLTKKDGTDFYANGSELSDMDRRFINTFYLPFKAREDVCVELDNVVYDSNNNPISEEQRVQLEKRLNMNRCSYPLP